MKVVSSSRDEEFVEIVLRWYPSWVSFFHNWNQLTRDLIDLVFSKKVRNFTGTQDVVEIFKETFVLNVIVGENE